MAEFARSGQAWLQADPENVVSMHCKAGKGRAGLMICVMMLRHGVVQSATEAIRRYDEMRVTNMRGLTVCSQRKFVRFYELLWRKIWGVSGDIGKITVEEERKKYKVPPQPAMQLTGVVIDVDKRHQKEVNGHKFEVRIYRISNFLPEKIYDSSNDTAAKNVSGGKSGFECTIEGNFKIILYRRGGVLGSSLEKVAELMHNTLFMSRKERKVTFKATQLDLKKRQVSLYGKNMSLRLTFGGVGSPEPKSKSPAGATARGVQRLPTDEPSDLYSTDSSSAGATSIGIQMVSMDEPSVDSRDASSKEITTTAIDETDIVDVNLHQI
jgi:hypothetical protein